jgi:hypothetical protein
MSNQLSSLTAKQLRHAADLKEEIESLNQEFASLLGTPAPASAIAHKKRKVSAAGRARMAAAQKARWAKLKTAKPAVKAPAKKRKMSAEAKAKLSASAKARWERVKAAGKTTL